LTDDSGFAEFADASWPRLVRIAHLLTGDFHEAEDLVQATFIKVYAHWPRLEREGADVHAYVRRALINNNNSRLRRRRVAQYLTPSLPDVARGDVRSADRAVDDRSAIAQALVSLPARQRTVVVLRYFEDLSDRQIADALGCSLGTVKAHAHRALAKLRQHPAFSDESLFSGAR
jgi:RNA polymerase sigma-70 factor (sigma-E family)